MCLEAPAIQGLAILNHDIIEWEACVIIMMFFTTLAVESTEVMSTMLQELLKEILLEVLTTMLLPCTSVQGTCILAHLFAFCNSTLSHRVLIPERFTDYSKNHVTVFIFSFSSAISFFTSSIIFASFASHSPLVLA